MLELFSIPPGWTREIQDGGHGEDMYLSLAGETGGGRIAEAHLRYLRDRPGEVRFVGLGVRGERRRQGIGRSMVSWFREQAFAHGLDAAVDMDEQSEEAPVFWYTMTKEFGDFDDTDMGVSDILIGYWRHGEKG